MRSLSPFARSTVRGALALAVLSPAALAESADPVERPICLPPQAVQTQVEPGLGLFMTDITLRVQAAFLDRLAGSDLEVRVADPQECADAGMPVVTVYLLASSDLRLSLISIGVSLTVLDPVSLQPVWGLVWVTFSSEDLDILTPEIVRAVEGQVDLLASTWRPEMLEAARGPVSRIHASLDDEGTLRAFAAVLEQYDVDHGRYPVELAALEKADPGGDPYFRGAATLQDAWGNRFHYEVSSDGAVAVVAALGRSGLRGGSFFDRDMYACLPGGRVVRTADPDDRRDLLEVCAAR